VASADGQLFDVADHLQLDVLVTQLLLLALGEVEQQVHQRPYFGARPAPVGDAEGIQSQELHALLAAGAHGFPHGACALRVALYPREPVGLSPAPIAVHDDRDVSGNLPERLGNLHARAHY
jgi:hypothetical protein